MSSAHVDPLVPHLAHFGLAAFRAGQREVIETVLAGQDCLCVMPTGGGKSLCYQLPAVAGSGFALVVSPLIALMKDQVDQLTARGLPATFINSTLNLDEQQQRLAGMAAGQYKLVYVVPERFRSRMFLDAVKHSNLKLLAIDEAHCVSEWGHDFRPDYGRLGHFRHLLGSPPTIALTATATDAVRRDIVELLNLHEPKVFITGFARPNLHYAVHLCSSDRDKDAALLKFLSENPGSGIVYASTRKRCEELGQKIAEQTRRSTVVYHAGMEPEDRRAAQDAFMQGRREIAVATLAFGMGIDKADVRFVVHYNLPGSLEAYYQEAGRAGRDGQGSRCLLLAGSGDRMIHEFFIDSAYPSREVVSAVYGFLRGVDQDPIELTRQEIKSTLGLQISEEGIGACEKLLEGAGVLERLETSENAAALRLSSDVPTLVDFLPRQATVKRQVLRAVEDLIGPRRNEWCYVQPREILRRLPEMDSTTLARHLRELNELTSVDYLPPFRGRAIHMVDRQQKFDELEIDFEGLDRQRAAEYQRLENVVGFSRAATCRQKVILEYFGQTDADDCGNCDNCSPRADGKWGAVGTVTPPVLHIVRVALSGVARVRRACGKQLLAQMLCGKSTKGVIRNRMDKLSTFGLLSHLTQVDVVSVVEALLAAQLLEQVEIEPRIPVLQLSERGQAVMMARDTGELRLDLPAALWRRLDPSLALPREVDSRLASSLRAWRNEQAAAQNVPTHYVLSNAVVDELARSRPQSAEALLEVKGFGQAKLRQYGVDLLKLLTSSIPPASSGPPARAAAPGVATAPPAQKTPPAQEALPVQETPTAQEALPSVSEAPRPASPNGEASHGPEAERPISAEISAEAAPKSRLPEGQSAAPSAVPGGAAQPSHYWTWRLLTSGFTPAECAAVRNLSDEVVLDHALRAADAGLTIDATWFLPAELIAEINRVVGPGEPSRLRDLLPKLPRGTRYEQVQLVLKARRQPTTGQADS